MAKKRTVLVTGGTGGIGTGICVQLAKSGYVVCANYLFDEELARFAQVLNEEDVEVLCFKGDVADYASCKSMYAQIKQEVGSIDILINNAGIARDAMFHKMQQEMWCDVVNVNLNSVFNVTRPIVDDMIASGWGRIVNISSLVAQKGVMGVANYGAAKAGMHGFTKCLAQELARHNITVNSISPGYIDTSLANNIREDVKQKIIDQIPAGRFGKIEEIVHAIAFLLADEAAYITGTNISVNGGQYMD